MTAGESIQNLEPPDGGFGWIVTISSFFIHVLVVGCSFSFGVFFPVYIEEFDAPPGEAAWYYSLSNCFNIMRTVILCLNRVGSIGAGLMTGYYFQFFTNLQ